MYIGLLSLSCDVLCCLCTHVQLRCTVLFVHVHRLKKKMRIELKLFIAVILITSSVIVRCINLSHTYVTGSFKNMWEKFINISCVFILTIRKTI